MRRAIERRWQEQLRQTGKPVCQRSGNLTWLTTMPLDTYRVQTGGRRQQNLFRFQPLIMRPRGALGVGLVY